jgi:hypothetical protein
MVEHDAVRVSAVKRRESPVLVVDSYARGISIGRADTEEKSYQLQIDGDLRAGPGGLRSRYVLGSGEPLGDLERHLSKLSSRGELRRTTIVFGVTTDPFHPFDEKFATSMKFLELFERYAPGKLIVQTRSPLIVIGLPVLKQVRHNTFVQIGIETPLEEVRQRYTPDQPTVAERWKTVRALKRFGFKVGVQVGPMLPYGDWRADARSFAESLAAEADFITVQSIADTTRGARPSGALASKLAADRQFYWLRTDTRKPLVAALEAIAPEKIYHPAEITVPDRQMVLFGG